MSSGCCRYSRLGLQYDPIDAAELVEVVDVERAELGLQGGEELVQRHALLLRLVAVDVDPDLRHVGLEGGEDVAQLRAAGWPATISARSAAASSCEIAAPRVLKLEVEAAGGAEAADGRRIEGDHVRLRDRGELAADALQDALRPGARRVALEPRLQDGEQHAAVGRGGAGEEAVAADGDDAADAGRMPCRMSLTCVHHLAGARQRRRRRQLDVDEEVALVLVRQERRSAAAGRPTR